MIQTPIPYSFANNRGTASKLKLHNLESSIHSPGLNKRDLPKNKVLISNSKYNVIYRIQYGDYQYAEVNAGKPNQWHKGLTQISGNSPTMDEHIEFMETVKILHPTIVQLFSR